MPNNGACVYPGNNSRLAKVSYKLNGQLIGYVSGDGIAIKHHADRKTYVIESSSGGPDIKVIGGKSLGWSASSAYGADLISIIPGAVFQKEYVYDDKGKLKMRSDSSGAFALAAKGLKEIYPSTFVESFRNVHDDEADGGTTSDSLDNFLGAMKDIAARCGGSDYFAYAGHGSGRSLPSAGLKLKTKGYQTFVSCLKQIVRPNSTVIFYACFTGISGGLCQALSNEIPGTTIYGHISKGHAFTNPETSRSYNGTTEMFTTLLGPDYYPKWTQLMKSSSDIWRRFPFMSIDAIKAEIDANVK